MTWTRLEGRYPQSRKVRPLSDGAFRADVEGMCWSNEEGTDGRITAEDLRLIGDGKRKPRHAAELVRRGRWHTAGDPPCTSDRCPHTGGTEDGWVIHDFHDYNPTRAEVAAELAAKRERQRRYMEKARRAKRRTTDTSHDGSGDASGDASEDVTPHRSAPPRSEGSGGGAPPSGPTGPDRPPAAASAADRGAGDRPPPAPPPPAEQLAKARRAIAAGQAKHRTASDRREHGAAFAELQAATRPPTPSQEDLDG